MQHGAAAALRLLDVGGHTTHTAGHCPLRIPPSPPSSYPWLQEARHSLGMKGARRQHGGQIHTGCESLCAATSHSHCDSSAQSSARPMLLAGRRREQCRGICGSSSPILQGRVCAQQGTSLPSVHGRSSGAGTGEGEKRRAVESAHLQIGFRTVGLLFPTRGTAKSSHAASHTGCTQELVSRRNTSIWEQNLE